MHDPDEHYREALDGAFPALEELRSQGVIASYGAGMNQAEMLADFVRETDLDVVMLAGRYTLLEQGALDDLLPECERRDVSVIAAGVFNSGLLARERPRDDATYNYEPAPPELLARVHRIADVLERHGTSLPVPRRSSRSPIPPWRRVCLGARSAAQVERNAALFDAPVPDAAWSELVAEGLLRPDAAIPNAGEMDDESRARSAEAPLLLDMQGVSKSFPGVKALEDMHLDLRAGEVLGLVGENGAGKSTLMKLLSGIYTADEGEFFLNGERYEPTSRQARAGARDQHHPPGVQPDARPDGRAEPLHRARAARRGDLHERAAAQRAGAAS